MQNELIEVNGIQIGLFTEDHKNDYISLTDIAKYKNSEDPRIVISNWMSSYSTIDFLAVWEEINNTNFNRMGFHTVRSEKGRLVMTPKKWIETTNAIGITSKPGRYGGTYAHTDIAFEFASWISPEFKLYIIKEYQRLKIKNIFITKTSIKGKKQGQFTSNDFQLFVKFYNIKDDSKYTFYSNIWNMYSYSINLVDFIYNEILSRPDTIIEELKKGIKKKITPGA